MGLRNNRCSTYIIVLFYDLLFLHKEVLLFELILVRRGSVMENKESKENVASVLIRDKENKNIYRMFSKVTITAIALQSLLGVAKKN